MTTGLSRQGCGSCARATLGAIDQRCSGTGKRHCVVSATGAIADVFVMLFKYFSRKPDMKYAMTDATIVRVHRRGQGAKGGDSEPGRRPLQRRHDHQEPRSDRCGATLRASNCHQAIASMRAVAVPVTMPFAKALLADRGCDADWLRDALAARRSQASSLKPRQNRTGKSRGPMTGSAIASVTGSRTCSACSRTGVVSISDMTAASANSSLPSPSQPSSATHAPRRLHGGLQLRAKAQDPRRSHALRIHLQDLDFGARQIHPQSDPTNAGTEQLGRNRVWPSPPVRSILPPDHHPSR